MQANQVRFDEESRWKECHGVEFVEAEDAFVEWWQRQFGNQIKSACDAEDVGDDLVIGCGELRAPGARTGVSVDDGFLESRVGGNVEGEHGGERASKAVSTDG